MKKLVYQHNLIDSNYYSEKLNIHHLFSGAHMKYQGKARMRLQLERVESLVN